MKIALVILHADPSRGGAERYTIDVAAGLFRRGHDVTLVASTFAPDVQAKKILIEFEAITKLGKYEKFIGRVMSERLDDFDIVHAMLPIPWCRVYHPHAGLAADAVVTGHEKYDGLRRSLAGVANRFNGKRQRFATVERSLLDSPDAPVVLCLSEYVKATVRKHYSTLPESKLATLFNAVDLNKFDPNLRANAGIEIRRKFNISSDRVVGLIIAQDYQRKGLAEAIEAMPLEDARLTLLVVGKQDPGRYRKLAHDHGVADRVVFAGPTTDPYSFYRAADFFVLPTRHDPCSLVVLEALAMGVPVISTAFNGACEIMINGTHGFVLSDPRDAATLRERYMEMLDNQSRERMAAACLELRPTLSQEHHLDRLLEVYSRVKRNQT